MKIDPEYWVRNASKHDLRYCERWGVNINALYKCLADYLKKEWGLTSVRYVQEKLFTVHTKCRQGRDGYFRCMGITLQIKGWDLQPHVICCYDGTVDREYKEGEVTWKHNSYYPCGGKYED